MAAKTTIKVATLTGAAKDDLFASATTGLTEDHLQSSLDVLANDPGAAKLYSLTQDTSSLSAGAQFPITNSAQLASGAVITINTVSGTIDYDGHALHASLQALAEGQSFTDTFTYTVRMANGALSTAVASVTIAGQNDAPTLTGTSPVFIFDSAADDTPGAVSGVLGGHDVDNGAVLTYSIDATTSAYGSITLDAATGAYHFTADADKIDTLRAGQSASADFTVDVTDEHGAHAGSQTLQFTIVGANDTAEISGQAAGSVAEDGSLQASGSLSVADRDAGDIGFQAAADLAGDYGDFTFDADSGDWTYALRNGDANVQALAGADTVTDTLTVFSLDGSAAETIAVSISGADEPVVLPPAASEPEPASTVTTYMVNHGRTDINAYQTFTGFDSDDLLKYAHNFEAGPISVIDTDNNGTPDSSTLTFSFHHGHDTDLVQVVLIGYTGLTRKSHRSDSMAAESPPRSAWLDNYGAGLPEFLAGLPQAAALPLSRRRGQPRMARQSRAARSGRSAA